MNLERQVGARSWTVPYSQWASNFNHKMFLSKSNYFQESQCRKQIQSGIYLFEVGTDTPAQIASPLPSSTPPTKVPPWAPYEPSLRTMVPVMGSYRLAWSRVWSGQTDIWNSLEALGRRMNIRRPVRRIQREFMAEGEGIDNNCVGDKISRTTYLIIWGSRKGGVSRNFPKCLT